ncbi:MAG: RidA family protein [Rhodocyclaceae bacterium]|nr:RidA family protein [Rhodocyclaceae bacterium]MCB1452172.1 RidA family protein [Rhizobiaceae bacterium]MCP5238864.1 RidA family protein [Zoogloeaceae bacterium]MCP5254248.1 RidA family protein [Zoogloeaceae bacterium]MCW5617302.1 RidA family protein [Rhodocyclaceae bacterium]
MTHQIQRIGGSQRFSQVVTHNHTVYLAGQVSQLADGDITAQSEDVFAKIDALLEQAGSDKNHMLSAQIWLADMDDYDAMNAAWDAWLSGVGAPVRACVESPMAKKNYRVEIMVIAAVRS